MNKILFIIDHLGCGGAERITLQLAEYLATHEHSIHLAVLNGRLNYYHCTANIAYTDLQLCESFAYGKMWKNKVLSPDEKTKIDTLLTNNFDLIITGYNNGHWLAPYLKGNVWHWIHGDLLEFRKFNNPLKQIKEYIRFFKNKRKFAKLFKNRNLITVNRDLESKAQTYTQPKSTVTIANGVQVSDDLIAQAPYTEKKWDVIFVGRLVPIKQVDHAIKAFSMSNLSGKMAIVGDGSERQKLEALTKELNISDRVDFLGWVDEPHTLMLQSKCLVMCSLYEGSPVTLAEAIALGVPIISYNSSAGITDLFSDEIKSIALVESQNIPQLSKNLLLVIDRPYLYSENNQNIISMKNMSDKFLNFISN
ncbi:MULTISPECIES: glycosyltransferase [unclassified Acinetobacter]|uniref:glycosyltransferase n=1 Tax=unclassified Acinetobacter TaxID=196816 RepID=UPI0015D2AC0B|nr:MULTISPECIES: glycosyltransferase [unclassified Acinetobacter]